MHVLYLEGDDRSLAYVQGALGRAGATVERGLPERGIDPEGYDALVLSGIEVARLGETLAGSITDAVRGGTGLLLAGGASGFGRGGYGGSPLARLLPVRVGAGDDRVVPPFGARPVPVGRHPLVEGLDFDSPPVLSAYHRVAPRGGGQVVLEVAPLDEGGVVRSSDPRSPLLVIGRREKGRIAAYAGDLGGSLTRWGGAAVPVGETEQVGIDYLTFLVRLAWWVGKGEREPAKDVQADRFPAGPEAEPATG
jgi:uncharacterized membrane protein